MKFDQPLTFTTNNVTTADAPTVAEMLATVRRRAAEMAARPREVFLYRGTLESFKRALEASGMVIGNPFAPPTLFGATLPLPLDGLQVHERNGVVWIAERAEDIEDALHGKIEVKVIV